MILRRSEEVAPIRFYLEVVFSQWQTCWSFAFTQMYQDLAKKIVSQNITIIETSFSSVLNWSCWRKPQIFVPFLHNKLWSVRCDSDLLVYVDVVWAGTFVRVLVWMARCSAESHTPHVSLAAFCLISLIFKANKTDRVLFNCCFPQFFLKALQT